jgi:dUTP pyrophosphatase
MILKIKKLREDAILPQYKTKGAAGMDLCSIEESTLKPGEIKAIGTGISIEIPNGHEGQVRPRSGLSLKGVTVINAPGTIDCDYRGEVKVLLINLGKDEFIIEKGLRVAQLIVNKCEQAELVEYKELSDTKRGTCGFGSTGFK